MNKTINQLENIDLGVAPPDASPMVQRLSALRNLPIKDFSVEDLRLCIGQDVGLKYLLPLALNALERDPFCEGMHYKGDLLCNVLRVSKEFYSANPTLRKRAKAALSHAKKSIGDLGEIDAKYLEEALNEAIDEFESNLSW